ncbi:MAG: hypothetical protein QMD77_04220 [Patescibacteria group bacterium]|nr:hypothetical protein [Patescibacteria group bacterium]
MPRWPEWITAEYLRQMTRCLRIGDIVFTPRPFFNPEDFFQLMEIPPFVQSLAIVSGNVGDLVPKTEDAESIIEELRNNKSFRDIFPSSLSQGEAHVSLFSLVRVLEQAYFDFCEDNNPFFLPKKKGIKEPRWFHGLPESVKGDLRAFAASQGFPNEVLHVLFKVPLTGVSYVVLENGITEKLERATNMWRLFRIFQLANLTDPVVTEAGLEAYARRFNHNALVHALDTEMISILIAFNNRRNLSSYQRRNLKVSAAEHDNAIPAGRDGTKAIDPIVFCEEINIGDVLRGEKWNELRKSFRLSTKLIVNTIRGQGVLGKILDIADKTAYLCRDIGAYLGRYCPGAGEEWGKNYQTVFNFVYGKNPNVCAIWDSVTVEGEDVFFSDPNRLGDFLEARALMIRNLYYNPGGRGSEVTISNIVVSYLYSLGILTKKDLLKMDDHELDHLIEDFVGVPYMMGTTSSIGDPFVETFKTLDEALEREAWLMKEEKLLFTAVDNSACSVKAATDYLVQTPSLEKIPFHEACPERVQKIAEIVRLEKPVFLHYFRNLKISDESHQKLREFRKQKLERRNYKKQ